MLAGRRRLSLLALLGRLGVLGVLGVLSVLAGAATLRAQCKPPSGY